MHILVVPSWYSGTYVKNNGSFFREQALGMKKKGHKVGIIYSNMVYWYYVRQFKKLFNPFFRFYDDQGLITLTTETLQLSFLGRYSARFTAMYNRWAWKRLLDKYISRHGVPDVIQAHSFFCGSLLEYAKQKYNIPSALFEHWSGFSKKTQRQARITDIKSAYDSAKSHVAVSSVLADLVARVTGKKPVVIPNCTYYSKNFIKPEKYECFTFLAIGYLKPIKNYSMLLEAFASKFKGMLNVRLQIAGTGSMFEKLVDQASGLEISQQVEFLGFVGRDEISSLIRKSHVVVSCSLFETFGVTLIESMAQGTPVLAADSGGPRSIVVDEMFGVLCENDLTKFADAMQDICQNYEKYDPEEIFVKSKKIFSESSVLDKVENLLLRASSHV